MVDPAPEAFVRDLRAAGVDGESPWDLVNSSGSYAPAIPVLVVGPGRQMIVLALGRIDDPRSVEALVALIEDDDVVGHAVMALGNLKASPAREALERCLEHPKPWVRDEARKALAE